MRTFATLFSGGELAGIGLQAAGLRHLWGVEYEDSIAQVARDNGFSVLTDDVRDVDYGVLERPDWLHMSPVCKNFSNAKSDGKEMREDLETAWACVRAIRATQPTVVSLENVWGYRKSESLALILEGLRRGGYKADYWHLNAADYGVPQTRKRLILVARRDRFPLCCAPTHHDASGAAEQLSLLPPSTEPWVGWYGAIEDLVPTLPESEFAPWQLKRLPEWVKSFVPEALLVPGGNASSFSVRGASEPSRTLSAGHDAALRALLVGGVLNSRFTTITHRDGEAPSFTITATRNKLDARGMTPQGRVVRMTPRALARFQSVPDWYMLPDTNQLACTVIGNGVPPLLMQRIAESQIAARAWRAAA